MIREIKPINLFILSWGVWAVSFVISPATYINITPALSALLVFVGYNLAFAAGLISIPEKKIPRKTYFYSRRSIQQLILILFLIGTIGVLLRFYQRLSFGISFDIIENRNTANDAGEGTGGLVSIVAALLFPFAFITYLLSVYFRHYLRRSYVVIIALFGFYPLIDSILLGGRSVLFFQGIAIFITYQVRKEIFPEIYLKKAIRYRSILVGLKYRFTLYPKRLFSVKNLFTLCFVAIFAAVSFVYINNLKASSYQKNYPWQEIMAFTEEARMVEFSEETKRSLYRSSYPLTQYGFLTLVHYPVHGVYEYIRWVNNIENIWGTHYGKYQFYVFVKFFKMIGVNTGPDLASMTYKTGRFGVFTTFWGPVYLDFGLFGILYAYFLGWLFRWTYLLAKLQKQLLSLLLYPFLGAIIFASTIINAAVGQNMYYFPAIFITVVILHITSNRKKRNHELR